MIQPCVAYINNKLDAGVSTHLLDPLRAVEGCVIYHQHRVRLRPSAAVMEELLNEVLKYRTICTSLKHTGNKNAVLRCREDLVPLFTPILSNLNWCYPKRRLLCPSESDPFVTARLIYVYEMIRAVRR
jgi:hypothetical protein